MSTETRVAIFSALDIEIAALVTAAGDLDSIPARLSKIRVGTIESTRVALVKVGIGKVNAAAAAASVIEVLSPQIVLFTGVAGGVDPVLGIGDVVIGERTIQHDAGVLADGELDIYQAGHVPFLNPNSELGYAPSSTLLASARRAIDDVDLSAVLGRTPSVRFGTIATGDQFVNDPHYRDRLHSSFGVSAVEMEGAAVAQVCHEAGVDHLIIRAVSDLAGEESDIDFGRFVSDAATNSATIARSILAEVASS